MALARKPLPLKPVPRARRSAASTPAAPAPPPPRRARQRARPRAARGPARRPRGRRARPRKKAAVTAAPRRRARARRGRRGGGPVAARTRPATSPASPPPHSCEELHDATDLPSRIGSRPRESRSPQGDGPRRAPRGALARRRAPPGQGPRGRRRGRRGRRRRRRPTTSSPTPARRSATRGAPTSSPRWSRRPRARRPSSARDSVLIGFLGPLTNGPGIKAIAATGRHELRDGGDPAHLARAVDGRALQPGDRRGLPRRADRRPGAGPLLPDADDRRGHDPARPGARAGRRRGRPAGDRDLPPARRRGDGVRHPQRRQGADPVAGREVLRGRGARRRRGRGRLRARAHAGGAGDPEQGADRPDGQVRRDHHDRARPRPPRAQARLRRGRARDEARAR